MELFLLLWLFSSALLAQHISLPQALTTYAVITSLNLAHAIDTTNSSEVLQDIEPQSDGNDLTILDYSSPTAITEYNVFANVTGLALEDEKGGDGGGRGGAAEGAGAAASLASTASLPFPPFIPLLSVALFAAKVPAGFGQSLGLLWMLNRNIGVADAALISASTTTENSMVSFPSETSVSELRYVPMAISTESSLSLDTVTNDTLLSTYQATPSIEDKKGCQPTCPAHSLAALGLNTLSLTSLVSVSILTFIAANLFGSMILALPLAQIVDVTSASSITTAASSPSSLLQGISESDLVFALAVTSAEISPSPTITTDSAVISDSPAIPSEEDKHGTPHTSTTSTCPAKSACPTPTTHSTAMCLSPHSLAPLVSFAILTFMAANFFGSMSLLLPLAQFVSIASTSSITTVESSSLFLLQETSGPGLGFAPMVTSTESSPSLSMMTNYATLISNSSGTSLIEDKKGHAPSPTTSTCLAKSACPTHSSAASSLDSLSLAPLIGVSVFTIAAMTIFGNIGLLLLFAHHVEVTSASASPPPSLLQEISEPVSGFMPTASKPYEALPLSTVTMSTDVSLPLSTAISPTTDVSTSRLAIRELYDKKEDKTHHSDPPKTSSIAADKDGAPHSTSTTSSSPETPKSSEVPKSSKPPPSSTAATESTDSACPVTTAASSDSTTSSDPTALPDMAASSVSTSASSATPSAFASASVSQDQLSLVPLAGMVLLAVGTGMGLVF
ncbi:hypothetical protein MMC10_006293 [Thelotrema lepadinum]|nr:hypothetical protein [Thelotrema lepadinum]